jgi:predicted small secreted protein
MKKQILYLSVLIVMMIFVSGCLAGTNTVAGTPGTDGSIAGFWMGLWHGVIAPVTFFISLITDNIHMYEVHNNGEWYDFGFVLGAGIIFGGGSKASCRKRR